jgi:PTH1 family peptidyl-tRNA hydrolase
MKLVAGLGNPGRRYVDTRHNLGFRVVERLAQRLGAAAARQRFEGELSEANWGGQRVLLLAPQTYMNRSGRSVLAARDFYRIEHHDILVVCDDFQLPVGRLRVRPRGSAGGQKGLDDVIQRLGDQQVPRLRIGIGTPPPDWDVADYVLSKFSKEDLPVVEDAVARAADAALVWVEHGIEACMNTYNASPTA